MKDVKPYNESDRVVDRDDFLHSLKQCMAFYGKDLNKMQATFWWTACNDKPVARLKQAFMQWMKVGRYAPKPVDILELVTASTHDAHRDVTPQIPTTNCPPEVAQAWMWFINRTTMGTQMAGLFDETGPVDLKTQERYLHVVNHEAKGMGMPEAIPDEFMLQEVWG